MRKWIARPHRDGICRAFEHRWTDPKRVRISYDPSYDAYTLTRVCERCETIKTTKILASVGTRKNAYMYKEGYLLKRNRIEEKLPSKSEQVLEILQILKKPPRLRLVRKRA